MSQQLCHRGPDGEGAWLGRGVGLGHRRLSIMDLSEAGRQPMRNEDGSVWIVFNGEVYNFAELKRQLGSTRHRFRSRTDSEVIVHLYEEEGIECLPHLRGMFALAVWDDRFRRLLLARDRFGKKPLYYRETPEGVVFASELDALLAGLQERPPLDPIALDEYLTYQYVPSPRTIFEGVRKLPPAHYLLWERGESRTACYWRLRPVDRRGACTDRTQAELLEELRQRFDEAVRLRLMADVPVGAFLSGGIDSSLVVASMARQTAEPVRTFSIGFDETGYDETAHARMVAARYRTRHVERHVRADAAAILPTLIRHFGEPFADSSAIPTYYLAQGAREHVKVVLSGDGADELFAGYPRYATNQWVGLIQHLPGPLYARVGLPAVRRWARGKSYTALAARLCRFVEESRHSPARRNAYRLSHFTPEMKARLYRPSWARRLPGVDSYARLFAAYADWAARPFAEQALYADSLLYLPEDLLTKVDRMAMAHGLEVRCPFLDHPLAEFVAALPLRWKLDGWRTKVALKRLGQDRLPAPILRRRKMGFSIPLDRWLRTALRPWLTEILLSSRALERGYFDPDTVRGLVTEHLAGVWDWRYPLWNLLVLELWHRQFMDGETRSESWRRDPGAEPATISAP